MTPNRIIAVIATVVIITAVAALSFFKREYVTPAAGLLDLASQEQGDAVVVSGALKGSGGKIIKTTSTRYGREILVRVYTAAIEPEDDPRDCRATFAVTVPLQSNVDVVTIGERANVLTVGQVLGVPIRIPRFRGDRKTAEAVWSTADRDAK